ncbi:hypothetical protein C7M84_003837 [Penaeus vannamei]|uniref:Rhodanese domain-containing protein n=1 Tax=Penaeus vannamei TaxID=6689 RepID=A0A3R7PND5_PENVA|nr:hypothetical protein C7M84_003837 [Penaeus vannamei]
MSPRPMPPLRPQTLGRKEVSMQGHVGRWQMHTSSSRTHARGKAAELLLVDVRLREEVREQGQLPGSHVLPVQELEEALGMSEADFEKKYEILVAEESTKVVSQTRDAQEGFSKVIIGHPRLYRGSFLDWTAKGGQVEKPGNPFEPKE